MWIAIPTIIVGVLLILHMVDIIVQSFFYPTNQIYEIPPSYQDALAQEQEAAFRAFVQEVSLINCCACPAQLKTGDLQQTDMLAEAEGWHKFYSGYYCKECATKLEHRLGKLHWMPYL